jgi:hypothetical protein
MHYVFDRELNHDERAVKVTAMFARGNHKSAQMEQDQVGELLAKDVVHGFMIPLPISVVRSIPAGRHDPTPGTGAAVDSRSGRREES